MSGVRHLTLAGLPAPLEVRESPRARRLTLRVDPARDLLQVVVPRGVPDDAIAGFVRRHADWVQQRVAALPPRQGFNAGATVPVLGADHVICHDAGHRGAPVRHDGRLRVGGDPAFLARRVHDYLQGEARRELAARSRAMAGRLGVRVAAVSLRDPRSRWGSCSSSGRLCFSWRLILTPEWVMDYVVAHEVCHLRELNHSARFWALVAGFPVDADAARAWLKTNGPRLLRIG